MKIIVKESDFNSSSKVEKVNAITNFVVTMLDDSLYEIEEINTQALTCYFVGFYDMQVSEVGLTEFLRENFMNILALDAIYDGLRAIGAIKHQVIYQKACEALNELDEDTFDSLITTGDGAVDDRFRDKIVPVCHLLDSLTSEFNKLENSGENLLDLTYDYIQKMTDIVIVKNDQYEAAIEKLTSEVPNYEQRLRRAEQEEHEELEGDEISNIVAEICTKFSLNLLSIDDVNFGQDLVSSEQEKINSETGVVYCHITTEEGKFYIISDGSDATLVEKNSKTSKGGISIH